MEQEARNEELALDNRRETAPAECSFGLAKQARPSHRSPKVRLWNECMHCFAASAAAGR